MNKISKLYNAKNFRFAAATTTLDKCKFGQNVNNKLIKNLSYNIILLCRSHVPTSTVKLRMEMGNMSKRQQTN